MKRLIKKYLQNQGKSHNYAVKHKNQLRLVFEYFDGLLPDGKLH